MPVHDPQQLYRVQCDRQPNNAGDTGDPKTSFSDYVFEHLRSEDRVLSALMAYVPLGFNKISVRTGTVPEEAAADMVSGNFFGGPGVRPACGRMLSAEDASTHSPVAVLAYGFASRRFGNACAAIGRSIYIKAVPFTIVGVAASSFSGVEAAPTDAWVPFQIRPELNAWGMPGTSYAADAHWWCILMMARVKPGVTKAAAEAALNPAFQHAAYEPLGGKPERGERPTRLHLLPARGIKGAESFQKPLLILQAMVGLLLVIACGNVSVLLAVRNAARGREFSLRLALGGSKGRLMCQLLAESLVLVGCGSVLGLLFAVLATRVLARWAELEIGLAPDRTVLLFTLAISVAAAVVFGIAPAFRAAGISIAESIKNSSATAHRDRSKVAVGNMTTIIQLALSLTLLVGAGLLVRTLENLKEVNIGFRTGGLLVFGINPASQGKGDEKTAAFYRGLTEKLRALSQVESVTLMGNRIATGWSNNTNALVDGRTPRDVSDNMLRWNNVGPDFFKTLGIRLLAGRDFNDGDTQGSAPVAIINRTFAERFLKGRNALGHTASFTNRKAFTIVGVAENSKYTAIQEDVVAMAWFPYAQVGDVGAMHFELRVAGPPAAMLPRVRQAVANYAPDLALLQPRTQEAEFDETIASQRLLARLSMAFAVLAIVLVAIGLYGTISYGVSRRTMEVGIRVALGAERAQVVWMILRGGILLCLIGVTVGIPFALGAGHLLSSLLYGVTATDPISITVAALGILAVGVIATYVPARRAAGTDPMVALRHE